MGILGLYSYIARHVPQALEWHELCKCKLVIDGNNLAFYLYEDCKSINKAYGGDYDKLARRYEEFFHALRLCEAEAVIVMDGGCGANETKVLTQMTRFKESVKFCQQIHPQNHDIERIFCPLGFQVLTKVAHQLGVTLLQSDGEADSDIAGIAKAKNMIVLSNDSDFYGYGVEFILLDSVNYNAIQKVEKKGTTTSYFIPCYKFNPVNFCKATKVPSHLLCTLGPLIGNDHIASEETVRFQKHLNAAFKRRHQVSGLSDSQKHIVLVLWWLQKEAEGDPEDVVMKAANLMFRRPKSHLRLINEVHRYQVKTSGNLVSWVEKHNDSCPVQTSKAKKYKHLTDIRVTESFADIIQCTCPERVAFDIYRRHLIPNWFVKLYRLRLISKEVMDIMRGGIVYFLPQVEDLRNHKHSTYKMCKELLVKLVSFVVSSLKSEEASGENDTYCENGFQSDAEGHSESNDTSQEEQLDKHSLLQKHKEQPKISAKQLYRKERQKVYKGHNRHQNKELNLRVEHEARLREKQDKLHCELSNRMAALNLFTKEDLERDSAESSDDEYCIEINQSKQLQCEEPSLDTVPVSVCDAVFDDSHEWEDIEELVILGDAASDDDDNFSSYTSEVETLALLSGERDRGPLSLVPLPAEEKLQEGPISRSALKGVNQDKITGMVDPDIKKLCKSKGIHASDGDPFAKSNTLHWFLPCKKRNITTVYLPFRCQKLKYALSDLEHLSALERRAYFYEFFEIPELQEDCPPGLQFILAALSYWYKHSLCKANAKHVKTLVICIIMFYICDKRSGPIRRLNSPAYKKVSAETESFRDPEVLAKFNRLSLRQQMNKLTESELKYVAYRWSPFHRNTMKRKEGGFFPKEVIHVFGEFQGCISLFYILNSVLLFPFPFVSPDSFWSGSFGINVYLELGEKKNYARTMFSNSPRVHQLYLNLYKFLQRHLNLADLESYETDLAINNPKYINRAKCPGTVSSHKGQKSTKSLGTFDFLRNPTAEDIAALSCNRFAPLMLGSKVKTKGHL